ncbi:DNA gyrase inhibitor YacG [Nereida sp. NH-UV-3]|uniref:DNA gyrase inhibitor YacG n=1 Tax=Nereida TaxID=282198 RepID=UPI0036F2262D
MPCPICKRDADKSYKPFCSKRCADIDLAKWLCGDYAIASTDPDDVDQIVDALEIEAERAAKNIH